MIVRLLVVGILGLFLGIPASVTWMKGQRVAFLLGFLVLGTVWLVAASRLAHPSSWWARRFYGAQKMRRAEERFGSSAFMQS